MNRPTATLAHAASLLVSILVLAMTACPQPASARDGDGGAPSASSGVAATGAAATAGHAVGATMTGGSGGGSADPGTDGFPNTGGPTHSGARSLLAGPLRWLKSHTSRDPMKEPVHIVTRGAAVIIEPMQWLFEQLPLQSPDQDRAHEAVRKGQIVPLNSVLTNVRKSTPGDVLKVSLNQDDAGKWSYSITVLTTQGYYRDVIVDAASNHITRVREH